MTYVRIYRYKIDPACRQECRAVLEEVRMIYEQAGITPIYICEKEDAPGEITDISMANDRAVYESCCAVINKNQRVIELYESFEQMMLPGFDIVTEHYESWP